MEFRILGPLEIRNEGGPVALGGTKPRALLTVLLLHANEAVSAERLAQALWGDDAPAGATKTVQVLISRLRKGLGDPDIVATTSGGYRLRVQPGELDAERFELLVKDGEVALRAGHPERAATILREALALWRGPALADVVSESFAQSDIVRLEEQRLAALEARLEADLGAGRHAALVGELLRLVSENPTRERLVGQLMLSLYRSGRQADALDVYQRTRERLDAELGLEPEHALKTLQAQILGQAPALDLRAHGGADGGGRIPLPPALRALPTISYVGRTAERSALAHMLEDACSGSRWIVLFGGEPGVGKTRLAAHTALEARAAGFAVSWGSSAENLSAPYSTWIETLSYLVDHASDDVLALHVAAHGGELTRLVASIGQRVADVPPAQQSDPETERYLLFSAVAGLLEALCAAGPVALVLDDLQWADPQSLALLQHVARATPHLPLVILGTYRNTDLPAGHPLSGLLAELHRVQGLERMVLAGLDVDEVAELMSRVAGHDIGAGGQRLAAEITAETDGNPFFVGQILHHLRESGAVEQDEDGRWHVLTSIADLGLPQSVHEVIARRVERLGGEAEAILTVAAVIGRSFDVKLLERLVGREEDQLLAALEAATEGAVLVESSEAMGRFVFAHALIRHSLYETLSALRRARMHGQVAEALEQLSQSDPGEHVAELAHHWGMASDSAYAGKAVHYARLAGERALEQLAPDDAIRWFTQALDRRPGDDAQRCDVLTGLGEAQRQLGDREFRDTLLEASSIAERLGDPHRLTRAVLANTLGPFGAAGSRDQQRVDAIERALTTLPGDWPYRPRMLSILGKELYYSGDPLRGVRLSEEALALASSSADRREFARVMAFTTAISPIAPLEAHAVLVHELAELAEEFSDPELRFRAANARFIYGMHAGDAAQLNAALAMMLELAAAIGQPILRWTALWAHSAHRMLAGDLDEAEKLTMEAAAVAAEHSRPEAGLITFGQLLAIRTEQDRLAELAEPAERFASLNPRIGLLRLTCAFIAAETGHREDAAAMLAQIAADGFVFPFDRTRAFNLARCADVALRVQAHEHAAALYDRLLPWRSQFATPAGISSRGSIELSLGRLASVLGRGDVADEHFAGAQNAHERLRAPLLQARTCLAQAEALYLDEPARATELLGEARTLARRHGSSAIEREALALPGAHAPI